MVPLESWLAIDKASRRVRLDPGARGFFQNPYGAYRQIRSTTSVFYWEEQKQWSFMDHADVSTILRDRRFGRELPGREPVPPAGLEAFHELNRHSMLEREPPVHTRLRTLVNHAFLSRAIERLQPRIERLAHELIDRFESAGTTELIASFATPIPVVVIAELLGVPTDMAPQLLEWSHRMVGVYQLARTPQMEAQAEQATLDFIAFIKSYLDQRRKTPADDLISRLLAAEEGGQRLTEDEMVGTCILLLNAGHEATVHAAGNAVKTVLELGIDPQAVFATPAATEATIEECLRYDPPLHLFNRIASVDSEIGGVKILEGESIALLYGAANRDPARYHSPDEFVPSRPKSTGHMAFGGGIHFCLGAPLARLELQTSLPLLFKRLPRLRLETAPTYKNSFPFHGLESLHVTWG